jgi:hypothetical protein
LRAQDPAAQKKESPILQQCRGVPNGNNHFSMLYLGHILCYGTRARAGRIPFGLQASTRRQFPRRRREWKEE